MLEQSGGEIGGGGIEGGSGGGDGEQLEMRGDDWQGEEIRWVHRQSDTSVSCRRLSKCDSHVL